MTAERYSIGQLAGLSGLPVKTIRFYADEGILPPPARTEAGHRRFGEEDLARLQLVRSLRELGVDLPTVSRVLEGRGRLGDVLRAHIATVETRVRALQRQLVVLRAAGESPTRQTVRRVQALAKLDAEERRRLLEGFWDRAMEGVPIDPQIEIRFRTMGSPELPDDPTPEQLDAWIELADMIADPAFQASVRHAATWIHEAAGEDVDTQQIALASQELGREAADAVASGLAPDDPAASAMVDGFARSWAAGLGRRDGPEFRAWLVDQLSRASDPRASRYWALVATISGARYSPDKAAQARTLEWLTAALRAEVERTSPGA